jgi:hypothetical protein
MGPPKGTINNPNGRPAGSQNKATRVFKEWIASFIDSKIDDFSEVYDRLDDKDKAKVMIDLLAYVTPKMASASMIIETIDDAKKTVHDLFPDELKDDQPES